MTALPTTAPANIDLTHNALTQNLSRHLGGVALNGSLGASLIALVIAVVIVLGGVFGVFASALGGSIHQGQPKEVVDKLVASHTSKIDEYEKRFNGRSIFYKPPPAARPAPPPPPPVDNTPQPPPPQPGPPSTYSGPSIAWVIGNDVYFSAIAPTLTEKYLRISVGEERKGLKVVNLDKMPRTVRVAYQGGEYDVKVFGDSTGTDSLFPNKPRASAFLPGIIEAGATPPAMPATPAVEQGAGADEAQADAENAAAGGEEGAASGAEHRPNRPGRPRGEHGRPRPSDRGSDKPDSGGTNNAEQSRPR